MASEAAPSTRRPRAEQQVQVGSFSPTGYDSTKPNVILKLEQGEEPWVADGEFPRQFHPGEVVECEFVNGRSGPLE